MIKFKRKFAPSFAQLSPSLLNIITMNKGNAFCHQKTKRNFEYWHSMSSIDKLAIGFNCMNWKYWVSMNFVLRIKVSNCTLSWVWASQHLLAVLVEKPKQPCSMRCMENSKSQIKIGKIIRRLLFHIHAVCCRDMFYILSGWFKRFIILASFYIACFT